MNDHPTAAVRDSLSTLVRGKSLELGAASTGAIAGTELIDRESGGDYADLHGCESGSIDAIVSWRGPEFTFDLVAGLREWRRVLRDGGKLGLVMRDATRGGTRGDAPHAFSPASFERLLNAVGGFETLQVDTFEASNEWFVTLERRAALDLREVFGLHGAALADAAQRNPESRAELYFQFGTVLLRTGDAMLAAACFEALHELEPSNVECMFGIGMSHAIARRWTDAAAWLERAIEHDPGNKEAHRWNGLVQLELAANSVDGITPQSAVADDVAAPSSGSLLS